VPLPVVPWGQRAHDGNPFAQIASGIHDTPSSAASASPTTPAAAPVPVLYLRLVHCHVPLPCTLTAEMLHPSLSPQVPSVTAPT